MESHGRRPLRDGTDLIVLVGGIGSYFERALPLPNAVPMQEGSRSEKASFTMLSWNLHFMKIRLLSSSPSTDHVTSSSDILPSNNHVSPDPGGVIAMTRKHNSKYSQLDSIICDMLYINP